MSDDSPCELKEEREAEVDEDEKSEESEDEEKKEEEEKSSDDEPLIKSREKKTKVGMIRIQ